MISVAELPSLSLDLFSSFKKLLFDPTALSEIFEDGRFFFFVSVGSIPVGERPTVCFHKSGQYSRSEELPFRLRKEGTNIELNLAMF